MFSLGGVQHRMRVKTYASSLSEETELLQDGFGQSYEQFDMLGLFHDCAFLFLNAPFASNLVIP